EHAGSDIQLGIVLGELLEQTGSSAHVVLGHRQTNEARANQRVVQQRKVRIFQGATRQGVTNNAQINVVLAGLVTQSGDLRYGKASVVGDHSRESTVGGF